MRRPAPLLMPAARLLFVAALLLNVPATAAAETISSLREAELLALERNLELQAQTREARAGEAQLRRQYGLYDPRFEAFLAEGQTRDPFTFEAVGGGSAGSFIGARLFEYRRFDFSLTQKVPTGADLVLTFANQRQRTLGATPPPIDPTYESELKLSLVQPLLKGFGRTVTEEQILLAARDREISLQDLRERAFDILSRTRDAYYEVLRQRDNVGYREISVALAQKVLDENQARVEVGVLPPVEILEAEVGLTTRERDLLDARRFYQDALDSLAVLLNAGATVEVAPAELGRPALATDEAAGFESALRQRPDVLRRLQVIERLDIQRRTADNRRLPQVDLVASYGHKGFGEEYSDDMDLMAEDTLRNWEIGLSLAYPIGNREARNDYLRTVLQQRAERSRLAQLREEVRQEIRGAIRQLDVSAKVVDVAARGRELSEEKLRTLLKRKEVGLATTRDVLEGEEDLANARTAQIDALADYNNAITAYLRVTGLLLEHEGVALAGPPDPRQDGPLLRPVAQ